MVRLSQVAKHRILSLRNFGLRHTAISRRLLEEDGIKASRQAISAFIKRHEETGSIEARHGGGRPALLKEEHLNFIEAKLGENCELNGIELSDLLKEHFNIEVSSDTVLRWRKKLGWRYGATRYCQMVSDINKGKRLEFAQSCVEANELFEDVIFTDESLVQLQANTRRQCYKKGAPVTQRIRAKPKHPYQVHALT